MFHASRLVRWSRFNFGENSQKSEILCTTQENARNKEEKRTNTNTKNSALSVMFIDSSYSNDKPWLGTMDCAPDSTVHVPTSEPYFHCQARVSNTWYVNITLERKPMRDKGYLRFGCSAVYIKGKCTELCDRQPSHKLSAGTL